MKRLTWKEKNDLYKELIQIKFEIDFIFFDIILGCAENNKPLPPNTMGSIKERLKKIEQILKKKIEIRK